MSAQEHAERPPAIVVGLDCITGLQTARILALRGISVIGIADNPRHFCCRTRLVERVVQSRTNGVELIHALTKLAEEGLSRPVIFPCSDAAVSVLSEHRQLLEDSYRLALPEVEVVRTLMDKVSFYEFALAHDLPIPQTFLIHNREEAESAAKTLAYPCIVKPPTKSAAWQQNTKAKAYKVHTAHEFLSLYDKCRHWTPVVMAQQWITGGDETLFSCNCYFSASSEPLATFIARKIRQWPPETGTSCLGEEVRNDVVLDVSLKLFRMVEYRGLGYVEMKRDETTGRYYIIEPNIGRPTGRSAIAEAGGVEILLSMYCDLAGLPLPAARVQTYGHVKWIYWRNDLRSAFYYWRRGTLTLRDILESWRGRKSCAVFSLRDPAPFIVDIAQGIAQHGAVAVRRILRVPENISAQRDA